MPHKRRYKATPEQREAARKRTAEVHRRTDEALADAESTGATVAALAEPGMVSLRILRYSTRNLVMLFKQAEELGITLSDVATRTEWNKRGRLIIKGQPHMKLVRPSGEDEGQEPDEAITLDGEAREERGEEGGRPRFRTVRVWDYSQTRPMDEPRDEVEPYELTPAEEPAAELYAAQVAELERAGYTVDYHEEESYSPAVYVDHEVRTVDIISGPEDGPADETDRAILGGLVRANAESLTLRTRTPRQPEPHDDDFAEPEPVLRLSVL